LSRSVSIRCDVDIEQTPESFHAYAIPQGIAVNPGDIVLVHDVPTEIGFGERMACECKATVRRAGPLRRAWTRAVSIFSLTSLYEVGFEPEPPRIGRP
jgi:hypothetical protein